MIRTASVLFLLFVCLLTASAQINDVTAATAPPSPGVGHNYIGLLNETVDPANGGVSLRLNLPIPQSRGLTLPFAITYDSNAAGLQSSSPGTVGWSYSKDAFTSGPSNWSNTIPQLTAVLLQYTKPGQIGNPITCYAAGGYVFKDPSGGKHSLHVSAVLSDPTTNISCLYAPNGRWQQFFSGGDDFYQAAINGISNTGNPYYINSGAGTGEVRVAGPDGTTYVFNHNPQAGSAFWNWTCTGGVPGSSFNYSLPNVIEDRNGNMMTLSGCPGPSIYSYSDTAGRTALSVSNNGSTIAISGLSSSFALTLGTASHSSVYLNPVFVAPSSDQYCGSQFNWATTTNWISKLTLPDNQSYQFSYDSTYGMLSKITYPSGGYISYTWGLNPQSASVSFADSQGQQYGCMYNYDKPAILHRYVSYNGTTIAEQQDFSYSTTWGTYSQGNQAYLWLSKQTTITTHDLVRGIVSSTVYSYGSYLQPLPPNSTAAYPDQQIPVEKTVTYKDGNGNVLRTVYKGWNDQYEPAYELQVLNDGTTMSSICYSWGPGHTMTDKKEYDFGQVTSTSTPCPAVPPARETITSYQTFPATPIFSGAPSILDKPASISVYGNGTLAAQRLFFYDQSSVTGVTGLPSGTHDDMNYGTSYNNRANITTKTVKCLQSGCVDAITTHSYDTTGQILSMVDPNGNAVGGTPSQHTTTFSYTDSYTSGTPPGNTNTYLTQITRPATNGVSHIQNFSYSYADGQLTRSQDENGQITSYIYNDSLDRLTETDLPDGGWTKLSYNDAGPSPTVTQQELVDGNVVPNLISTTVTTMDGMGHVVTKQLTSDPEGTDTTDTAFDGYGQVWTQSNPHRSTQSPTDGTTTYTYDALGRTTQVSEPDGSIITTTYSGKCKTVTDEAGKVRVSCSDALGRMTSVVEDPSGIGHSASYTYGPLNNLLSVTENATNLTGPGRSFQYDSLSRLTSATNPESGTTTYGYDANGNLTSRVAPQPNQINALTETTNYSYDALNRVTQKSYVGISTPTVKYGYDGTALSGCTTTPPALTDTYPINRRTAMCDGSGAASWSHDKVGQILSEKRSITGGSTITKTVVYTWNQAGGMKTLTYPGGHTVSYTYSNANRALSATDTTANPNIKYVSSATYAPTGNLTGYIMGNTTSFAGITASPAYNNRLQLSIVSASRPNQTIFSLSYGYGPTGQDNGNVATVVNNLDNNRTQTFTYDSMNRLYTAQSQATAGTACWGQRFGYDPWGNLLNETVTKCTAGSLSVSVDANNHLIGSDFSYDAAGNLTKEGSSTPFWTYSYDAENRLTTLGGSASDTMSYDGDGERVYKSNGSKFFRMHGGPFLSKTTAGGTVIVERIYFNGTHIAAWHPSGSVNYFMQDSLGGEHIVTDASGNVLNDIDTLPFGGEIDYLTSADPSYKFAGMERDDENSANLDYDVARYYDSRLGRFLTPDWAESPTAVPYAIFGDPQTLNLYSYVTNAPLNRADATGHGDPLRVRDSGTFLSGSDGACSNSLAITCAETAGNIESNALQVSQAQNNGQAELKGPYVADLKSKNIAPLLDPNHKPSESDIIGNGQCVTACSKFSGVTGDTKRWRAGADVADNGDTKPGTAIATFDSNGRYPSGKDKNSGIYLGPGAKGSIWILDQWPAHAPNPAHPPQPREVLNDNRRGASNNANAYHVILVAPEE